MNFIHNFLTKMKNIKPEIWLLIIVLFGLCLRLAFFVGLAWSDDPGYVSDAYRVMNGEFFLGKYLPALRVGIIYPIALCFKIFGINNFSAALYPLLCSLGMIIVTYYLGKILLNERVGLLSAFFVSIFPIDIQCGTWPMPDEPLAFLSSLSILLFLLSEKDNDKFKKRLLYFFSGVTIGLSYLTNISGLIPFLFLVPFVLYKFLKNKKIDFNYSFLFVGFLMIFLLEGTFYYKNAGDFLLQYHVVSGFYGPNTPGINRDFWFYPNRMFNLSLPHSFSFNLSNKYFVPYGLFYYFVLIAILYIIILKKRKYYIPLFWLLFYFLYHQFGTMSLTQYLPVHKLERHLTVLTVPAVLCLSCFLIDFYEMNKSKWFPLQLRKVFVVTTTVFLLITSIYYSYNMYEYTYASTWDMKEIYNFLKNYPNKKIYCDIGTLSHLRFYYGFKNDFYIRDLASVENTDQLKGSFVILDGSRGVIENSWTLPSFLDQESNKWYLKNVISGPKVDIWARYDPKIYYVP